MSMAPSDDPVPSNAPPSTPQITSVRYDAGLLTVAWTADPHPSTTFTVTVYQGGTPPAVTIAQVDVGASQCASLWVRLSADREPYVVVNGHSGSSSGRDSAPVPVVLDTVAVAAAETDPGTGALALSWAGTPEGAFLLRLSVNEGSPDPELPVSGTSTVIATPPRPGTVAAASLARTRVFVNDDESALSIGPYGAAFAVPTTRPDVLGVQADGNDLAVSWTAVTSATGYRITVLDGASVVARRDVPAPATRGVLPAGLDPDNAYAVVVQALVATGSGPASAPVAVVLRPPGISATTCDGTALSIAVTPPFGVMPTAYDVTVLQGSAPVRTVTVPPAAALTLALDWPVPVGAAHTVAVRARAGRASSPAATAPAVVGTPAVESVRCSDDLLVRAGLGALPPTDLGIDAVLVADGAWGIPQRVDPGGWASFPIPSGSVAVAVRGVLGIATGPWSVPVPAPTALPEITSAVVDGGRVALAWTGKSDGRYRVLAAGSDGLAVETVVDGCSAALAIPTSATVDARISEVAGVAMGPWADQTLLTQGPTLFTATVTTGRVVTVDWARPTTGPALEHVQPVVRWDGGETTLPPSPPAPPPLVLTLPDDVPGGASIALRGISGGGGVTGPLGNAAAVLTVAPTGLAVSFDDADLDITWDPVLDALVDRYVVTLAVPDHNPVVAVVAEPHATIPYPPAGLPAGSVDSAPTVTVAAMSGDRARGLACQPVDVVADEPALSSARYDGEAVRLTWAAPPTERAARVAIATGGVVGHQLDIGGTEAVVPLRPGPWTANVRFTGSSSVGRASSVALVTGTPSVQSVRFAAATGACEISWAKVDGAAAYTVTIVQGTTTVHEQSVDAPATSCVVPADTFAAAGGYAVRVTATASSGGCAVEGPPSALTNVPSMAPLGVEAAYDGTAVRVTWDAVTAAPVSGYRVSTLVGNTATALGDTAGTDGSWSLQATPSGGGTVVVQAIAGADVGAPSEPVALFPPGLFLGRSFLFPGNNPAVTPAAIVLSLPNLFTTAPDPSKLAGLDPTLGFTLAPASPPFGYTLTIPATSKVWDFDDRVDVIAAWTAFVKKLQQPSFTVTAYGILAMQEALSRAMPQTFAESLYFAYGVQFKDGCFDLRPGMVLRCEYEAYQVVGPSSEQAQLSGFVTTAAADYEVAAYQSEGRWLTGLDAFLASLATQGGVVIPLPVPPLGTGRAYGSGGLLDAFAPSVRAPFCRIVYPRTFIPTNSNGVTTLQGNAVLLASTSIDALNTATKNVRGNLPPGAQVAAAYLRGRTVIRPMTRVSLNGTARLVPVGTTVGQLLASSGHRPPVLDRPLQGVSLRRARAAAVTDADLTAAVGETWPIRLDWSPGNPGWLDLPLLHGDSIDVENGARWS
ncbi:fibronectin type III domain-containing protein [Actinospica sp.]|uniref:fibronectin type III domain-containing protein n=1 Tax=Actinospica sp. TaxID=1872142 RepID=UPI002C204B38|nr:hypothetical protein [Actinospica sp.]HWG24168.1 hypothetical protein [Actinospica sp.]